jgi:allantoin racemase
LKASRAPKEQRTRKKENGLKIRIVVPSRKDPPTLERLQQSYAGVGNSRSEFTCAFLTSGPGLGAAYHEIATFLPELVSEIKRAEKQGVDGVVVAHYLDPGLDAGRELVSIPVLGCGHTSLRLASALARRISIISSVHSHLGPIEDLVVAESLFGRVVSIKSVEITRRDGLEVSRQSLDRLLDLASESVEVGARLIILALDGYDDLSGQVKEHLALRGHRVPVLDPLHVAIKHAENLVDMGLSHSKITYPPPEIREIIGYDLQFE